jgi:anti-sigma B factor antagonist
VIKLLPQEPDRQPRLRIERRIEPQSDRALLQIQGEVDLATSPELEEALNAVIDGGYRDVQVELAEVSFLDAQGLRLLVSAAERLKPTGSLLLVNPSKRVRRVLEITGLDESLNTYDEGG